MQAGRYEPFLCREGAYTDVGALNGSLWRPEAQPNVLEPSSSTLPSFCALGSLGFGIHKNVRLFLESSLRLHRQLGCHLVVEWRLRYLIMDFEIDCVGRSNLAALA